MPGKGTVNHCLFACSRLEKRLLRIFVAVVDDDVAVGGGAEEAVVEALEDRSVAEGTCIAGF